MPQKNLAKRKDIEPDVLRQRRDFYALALGLLIFNAAAGHLRKETSISLLPIKFESPEILFWSAWIGFAYFLWRFWLMSPKAWSRFGEEIGLQAGHRYSLKKLVAQEITNAGGNQLVGLVPILEREDGRFAPGLALINGRLCLHANTIVGSNSNLLSNLEHPIAFPPISFWGKWRAITEATLLAVLYERSFSDYVMPYLIAVTCILLQLIRVGFDPSFLANVT